MAALGVVHVERNSHQYFAGLLMYPEALQEAVVAAHPDLYGAGERGFACLRISDGGVSTTSLSAAPFGCGLELSEEVLDLLGTPGLP